MPLVQKVKTFIMLTFIYQGCKAAVSVISMVSIWCVMPRCTIMLLSHKRFSGVDGWNSAVLLWFSVGEALNLCEPQRNRRAPPYYITYEIILTALYINEF
jgi:hypothetical protein